MTGDWAIRFDVNARGTIEDAAKRALPYETGGLLIGYYADSDICVERAIEVNDPTATRSNYTRHRALAQQALQSALRDSPEFLGYVGDWHSHPIAADASNRDRKTATADATEKGMPLALVIASVSGKDVSLSKRVISPTREAVQVPKQLVPPPSRHAKTRNWRERMRGAAMARWWKIRAVSVYLCSVGLLLVLFAREAVARDGDATGAALAVLGGGAIVVAAFAPYIEGTLKLGGLEMSIRTRLIDSLARASSGELEAVVTLLEDEEIEVRKIVVPAQFVGLKLVDKPLQPLRQEHDITVIALRRPGETRWIAGGRISEEPLQAGMTMLVVGPPESMDAVLHS